MILLYLIIVGIIFVAMISCIDINRLSVKEYEIKSPKLKKDVTVAFLSDMHNKEHGKDNYKLIEAIRQSKPDIVLVGGDMIIAKPGKGCDVPLRLMGYLQEYNIFYGIGNHEYRMKLYRDDYGEQYEQYIARLEELGVTVLTNDNTYLDEYNIEIQGLMIDKKYYKRTVKCHMEDEYLEDVIGLGKEGAFRVLLAHNPEYFYAYKKYADLVVSGHVHGGIMKIPGLGGVISPRLRLFPKYDGGRFDEDDSTMIVSRGLGSHTLPIRVFNPAELDIVHLKCEQNK